jgi:hypothetical protein
MVHFADVSVPTLYLAEDPAGPLLITGRDTADIVLGVEFDG